jgi:hypothetical protein
MLHSQQYMGRDKRTRNNRKKVELAKPTGLFPDWTIPLAFQAMKIMLDGLCI